MGLTRDQALAATTYPTEEYFIEQWGDTVLLRGVSLGHTRLTSFVNAPLQVDADDIELPDLLPLPQNATKAEKTATRVARDVARAAMGRQLGQPSEDEKMRRRHVGTFILGVCDTEGNPMFRWEDATRLRDDHWMVVMAVVPRLYELSAPLEDLEEGKDS